MPPLSRLLAAAIAGLLTASPSPARDDPPQAPAPRPVGAGTGDYPLTVRVNARGCGGEVQLALLKDGRLVNVEGRFVTDLGVYCVAGAEQGELVLLVFDPSETTAAVVRQTLAKLQTAARREKVHLTINVLIPPLVEE